MARRAVPEQAIDLLGKVQDKALASALGVSARSIYRERNARGIGKPKRSHAITDTYQRTLEKLRKNTLARNEALLSNRSGKLPPAVVNLLGEVDDDFLAKAAGIPKSIIGKERRLRCIAPALPGHAPSSVHARQLAQVTQARSSKPAAAKTSTRLT